MVGSNSKGIRALHASLFTIVGAPLVALGLSAAGCSAEPVQDDFGSSSEATTAVLGPPRTTCSVAATATDQKLSLTTNHGGQKITVFTDTNLLTKVSTTSWAVNDGASGLMAATLQASGAVTNTQVTYGTALTGIQKGTFRNDSKIFSGNIDGRAIVPITIATHKFSDHFKFSDGKALPAVTSNVKQLQEIGVLLEMAGNDAPSACAKTSPAVVAAARTALWQNITSPQTPSPVVKYEAPLKAEGGHLVPESTPGSGQASPGPSSSTGAGGSVPNTLLNWVTPGCQQCESDCASDFWSWITLGLGEAFCSIECFIPGHGCNENDGCDSNQSTCGGDICCGPDSTCGNAAYGACCPKDNPVGCGDETKVTCFPAGTVCCGKTGFACQGGYACINQTAMTASCCPNGQVNKNGQCCDGNMCNGTCCGQGQCVNGQCCNGPTTSNGTCCDFGNAVCGNQCCAGSCGTSGQCCPPGFPNCQAPPTAGTSLLFWDTTANTGTKGSGSYNGSPFVREMWGHAITLRGTGFFASTLVTIAVQGSQTFTAQTDANGQFTTTITPQGSGTAYETITAQTKPGTYAKVASLLGEFEDVPR